MLKEKLDFRLVVALALYITSLFAANTLGFKIMPFLFGTHLSVAVFFFPFVFLTTDVIGQIYGKEMAKNFVWAGFISICLFLIYSVISLPLPWSGSGLWAKESYDTIFSISFRMSVASLLAFVIAEYQDVIAFFFFKKKLGGQAFWLQSNLSNLWSQLLDTGIFMFVAFFGVFSIKTIILMSIPWWLYKVTMGFLYTPLSYLGIYLLKYGNKNDQNKDI
jgi:queuosine precursor transporter